MRWQWVGAPAYSGEPQIFAGAHLYRNHRRTLILSGGWRRRGASAAGDINFHSVSECRCYADAGLTVPRCAVIKTKLVNCTHVDYIVLFGK